MSALASYRRLLRNGPLVRLLFGEFVSSIGDWLYLVALLVVVYQQQQDPLVLGIVGAARVVPYVVLSVPAGIVADRADRRLVLLATDVARGVLMLVLAWLVGTGGSLAAIVALSILATCFSAFFGPAIGAYLPSLVTDETELGPANSAWASLDNLAFIIGPAIGGLLIVGGGLTLAFLLNAISFGIVAVVLWGLPSRGPIAEAQVSAGGPVEPEADAEPLTDRLARLQPVTLPIRPIAGLATLDVVASFAFGGLGVLTVVLAVDHLHAGEEGTGFLNAAIGIGGLLGAIVSGALVLRRSLAPVIGGGALLLGVGLASLGASSTIGPALAAMMVTATGSLVVEVTSTTIFQRVVPDAVRGRALGAVTTISTLAYAGGSLALPVLADRLGIFAVLAGAGGAVVVAAAVAIAAVGPAADQAPDPGTALLARISPTGLFGLVPPARLEAAARRLRPLDVPAGTAVVREGEQADRFYIIGEGQLEVTQSAPDGSERKLRVLGPKDVFGEIGLLTGSPRTATVTALSDAQLFVLDGPDFLELVAAGPGLAPLLLDVHRGALVGALGGQEAGSR